MQLFLARSMYQTKAIGLVILTTPEFILGARPCCGARSAIGTDHVFTVRVARAFCSVAETLQGVSTGWNIFLN